MIADRLIVLYGGHPTRTSGIVLQYISITEKLYSSKQEEWYLVYTAVVLVPFFII